MSQKNYLFAIILCSSIILLGLFLKAYFPNVGNIIFNLGIAGEIIFGGVLMYKLLKNKSL